MTDEDLRVRREKPLRADSDAGYAARIECDLSEITPHISGPDTVQVMTALGDLTERIPIDKAYLVSCVNSREEDLAAAAAVLKDKTIADGVEFYVAAASREVQAGAEKSGTWKTLLEAGGRPLPPGCGPCIGRGAGLLGPGEGGLSATNRDFQGRMGSRDARCYLASPQVVAASAVAGYITAPEPVRAHALTRRHAVPGSPRPRTETVAILDGFPSRVEGRLVFVPQDNLNTDGIYGKDFTYRDDMTPAMMAEVAMANYDPTFAGRVGKGDVLVGGRNFGTGSSREQAVTCLQAAGIAMVIAASFSQTYLRNAFNNGFACIECPALVARLREVFADAIQERTATIIREETVAVDFASATITFRGTRFAFTPLGAVPQALIVAGGVENQVRERLGLG
ncbi:MAG: aconitase family protein [Acidobacteriota bacterium]